MGPRRGLVVLLVALFATVASLPSPVLTFDDDAGSTTIGFVAKKKGEMLLTIGSSSTCTKIDGSPECVRDILEKMEQRIDRQGDRISYLENEMQRTESVVGEMSQFLTAQKEKEEREKLCSAADMTAFQDRGVVGKPHRKLGLTGFGAYQYGTLSATFKENMMKAAALLPIHGITDGRHIIWGSDGKPGEPGGVELRFPEKVNLKTFKISCKPGSCDNGMYHIKQGSSLEYWDGFVWKPAGTAPSTCASQNLLPRAETMTPRSIDEALEAIAWSAGTTSTAVSGSRGGTG